MKTNIILLSAVLACSSLSFAAGSGSSSYGTSSTSSRTQGGTGALPTKDNSGSIYDSTINPDHNQSMKKNTRQGRASTDSYRSDQRRSMKDTDSSGQKTDQAPTTHE